MIHPVVSGNKYRKLASIIPMLETERYAGVLSFGGPYSNHIHALAWICRICNIPLTVFIRTYKATFDSQTLKDIRDWGAQIMPLSPSKYRLKDSPAQLKKWEEEYPGYLIIPEGGSHPGALGGIRQMMEEIENVLPDADLYLCPVGTGATLAGMVRSKKPSQRIVGISALKSSGFDEELKSKWGIDKIGDWMIAGQWHFGGYGQMTNELVRFIEEFEQTHGIRLDPMYNGKSMYAFCQYAKYDLVPPGSKVVFIHTGGLQGWRGLRF